MHCECAHHPRRAGSDEPRNQAARNGVARLASLSICVAGKNFNVHRATGADARDGGFHRRTLVFGWRVGRHIKAGSARHNARAARGNSGGNSPKKPLARATPIRMKDRNFYRCICGHEWKSRPRFSGLMLPHTAPLVHESKPRCSKCHSRKVSVVFTPASPTFPVFFQNSVNCD